MEDIINDLQTLEWVERRRIWQPFMEKYDCQVIGEVGVSLGRNFFNMIQHNPKEAVAIDAWINDGTISRNDALYTQEELDKQYANMKSFEIDPSIRVIREYSTDAVKHFPDGYFDFIYIDADHTFEGCLRDIKDWYPKVKRFLVGDDYRGGATKSGVKFGVREAVHQFVKDNHLEFSVLPHRGWVIIK